MFFGSNLSGKGCLYSLLIAVIFGGLSILLSSAFHFPFFIFVPFIFVPFMFKKK